MKLQWSLLPVLLIITMPVFSDARILRTASGGRIKTLDPIYADDLASRDLCGAIYDTLLQYDYTARPYKLQPSMLESMPVINSTFDIYRFKLRDDLRFPSLRQVTAQDVLYSLLRLADSRNHSPLYWLIRDKLRGLEKFREQTRKAKAGDYSMYQPFPGFIIHNDREFSLHLNHPDPRFLYRLAISKIGRAHV